MHPLKGVCVEVVFERQIEEDGHKIWRAQDLEGTTLSSNRNVWYFSKTPIEQGLRLDGPDLWVDDGVGCCSAGVKYLFPDHVCVIP